MMALIEFGLLMWSVAWRDVSDLPRSWVWRTCQRKSLSLNGAMKYDASSMYWLPKA
jgi:hypothetical protein